MFGEGVYLADDGAKADQYTRAADASIQTGDDPLAALHALLYPTTTPRRVPHRTQHTT